MNKQIPDGWKVKKLQQVAKIQTGLAKGKKNIKNPIKLPYLRVANVQDGYLDLTEIKEIEVDQENIERYQLQMNDILLTEGGDFDKLGRGHLWKDEIPVCLHQNHIFVVRVNRDVLDPHFFSSLTGSEYGKKYFLSCAKQTTNLASINSTQLKNFPAIIPPLPEQRRITEILGTWDEAITFTGRLIEAKECRKKALMQQLLTGKVRFGEFGGEEWREVRLGEITDLTAGGTPSTRIPKYWNGQIPWMKSGEIHFKRIFEVEGRITHDGLENSSTKLIPKNSVLIALAGQGITRGTVAINKIDLCTNQSVAAMIPDAKVLYYEYLFYNLDNRYEEFRRLSLGEGGRGGLNLGLLKGVKLPVPSLTEQHRIAEVLQACDEDIGLLEQKLAALKRQKQGLMQQLLTGRVRVKINKNSWDGMDDNNGQGSGRPLKKITESI
jgi:type I restriction enzyme S subunit